jgi:hypothetical protein
MKSKLVKQCAFGVLVVVMLWSISSCDEFFDFLGFESDDQTFDEMAVVELEVTDVIARELLETAPFPYVLFFSMNRIADPEEHNYSYYSDEACTITLQIDTLVTVNGKPPNAISTVWYSGGGGGGVYYDFPLKEGDMATFNQAWFFAKPSHRPYYRKKVRIITESVPIEYW